MQQWLGNDLNPADWGWELDIDHWKPVTSLKEPIPSSLLHLITCNWGKGCEINCECRKCGLPCSHMCSYCAGHGCNNQCSMAADDTDDIDEYIEIYNKTDDADISQTVKKGKI